MLHPLDSCHMVRMDLVVQRDVTGGIPDGLDYLVTCPLCSFSKYRTYWHGGLYDHFCMDHIDSRAAFCVPNNDELCPVCGEYFGDMTTCCGPRIYEYAYMLHILQNKETHVPILMLMGVMK